MEKIKQQLNILKKSIIEKTKQFYSYNMQKKYSMLLSVKSICLLLAIILLLIPLIFYIGKSSEAATISQYTKKADDQSETILQLKLDVADLKREKEEIENKYNEIEIEFDNQKDEIALFNKLSDEDKKEITEKINKREAEETAKEELKQAEEAKKKEEERLAAEAAAKENTVTVATAENEYDYEKEYDVATQEVADILNDSFSNLGYFSFDDTDYTFTLHVTDPGLEDNIAAIMNGALPAEQWTHYITDGMVELSTTISNTYGYGWFSLAVANPFGSDYQLLKVVDGEVVYDFVDELN